MSRSVHYSRAQVDSDESSTDGDNSAKQRKESVSRSQRIRRKVQGEPPVAGKRREKLLYEEGKEGSGATSGSGHKFIVIVVVMIIVFAVIGVGAYLLLHKSSITSTSTSSSSSSSASQPSRISSQTPPSSTLPPTSQTQPSQESASVPSSSSSASTPSSSPASSLGKASTISTSTKGSAILSLSGSKDTVSIALLGATVYSYIHNGVDRIFLPEGGSLGGPSAVDGGVPICWPNYEEPPSGQSLYAKLPFHGIARTLLWTLDTTASVEDDSGASAVFNLASSSSTLATFNVPFALTFTVLLSATSVTLSLLVNSPASATSNLGFQTFFHFYLRLPSSVTPEGVTISPLKGLTWEDSSSNHNETTHAVAYTSETYSKYFDTQDQITLSMSSGGGTLSKTNLPDLTMWNNSTGDANYNSLVALEPGSLNLVSLKPGGSWTGSATLTFSN